MESYKSKYQKYKIKYLDLQNQIGGIREQHSTSSIVLHAGTRTGSTVGHQDQLTNIGAQLTPQGNPRIVRRLPCLAKVIEYGGMNPESRYSIITSGEGGASGEKPGFIKQIFRNGDIMFSNQNTEQNYYVNYAGYSVIGEKIAKVEINDDKKIVHIIEIEK